MTKVPFLARRHIPWLVVGGVFFFSLGFRLVALNRYITPDELVWVYRSIQFREALLHQDWQGTLTTGHPGVITMWLGATAVQLQLWLFPADHSLYEWLTQVAWYAPENTAALSRLAHFLTAGRVAVALVNSLGLVGIYGLVQRLYGRSTALLSTAVLMLDPFVVGLSGLLHVDGLMTTFATLSLLALALMIRAQGQADGRLARRWAVLGGSLAALAVLSKSPALLLLPFTALWLLLAGWQQKEVPFYGRLRLFLGTGLTWLGTYLLVTFLAFPALWTSPQAVLLLIRGNANRHIETALRPTFFMGQMTYDHGPFFYPTALLFRLSPFVLLGLIIALVMGWQRLKQQRWPSLPTLIFMLWPLLFVIGITLAAKKFDRYALPAIPALTLLAAYAWRRWSGWRSFLWPGWLAALVVYLVLALPYPLAAYNPLVGGAYTAQYVLPIGWGESVGAAGRWLAAQPDASEKTAVSGILPALAPFFPGQTRLSESQTRAQAHYIIVTANGVQADPEALEEAQAAYHLLHTIHFGGLDQAWIFAQSQPQSPPPLIDLAAPLTFDNRVQLLAAMAHYEAGAIQVDVRWRLQPGQANGSGPYTVKLTLRDAAGQPWSGLETPLLNQTYFYPVHWAPDETPQLRYSIPLPPALPPGDYQVDLSLLDGQTQAQLPLLAADGTFQGVVYALDGAVVPPAPTVTAVSALQIGIPRKDTWFDESLILWGHEPFPPEVTTGSQVVVDLYWQAVAPLAADLALTFYLGPRSVAAMPLSGYPSQQWRVGEVVHEKYRLSIPPDLPTGSYPLQVVPTQANGETAVTLAELAVQAVPRRFQLPDEIAVPLDYQFGPGVYLRGLTVQQTAAAPGDRLELTLYWQMGTSAPDLYTVFVHVLAPDGQIVAQADQWPGGLPTTTLAVDEVMVDAYALPIPPDAPAGPYRLALGLYTADNGQRLPVTDATHTFYADNRVIVPLP